MKLSCGPINFMGSAARSDSFAVRWGSLPQHLFTTLLLQETWHDPVQIHPC
jgi:hypothetical protein